MITGTAVGIALQLSPCPATLETVTTANIYLAASLMAEGARILDEGGIDRTDPKHVRFTLVGDGVKKMEREWWNGDSLYRRFSERLRDLKDCIRM